MASFCYLNYLNYDLTEMKSLFQNLGDDSVAFQQLSLYCSGLVFCLCKILRLCIVEEEEEELVLVEFEFVVVFKLVVTRQLFSIVVLMSLAFSLLVLSASLLSSVGVLDFVSDFSDLRPRDHVRKSNALTIGLFGPEEESEELFDFHKLFFKFSLLVLVIGYNNKKLMCLRCLAYSYIARYRN
uniref:Uncharacterized protein n=1 Tax=Glossina palpalis gambiensis TaxID=67801 RepID=A0A1B0C669_9MUSC